MNAAIGMDGKTKKTVEVLQVLEVPEVGKPVILRTREGVVKTSPVVYYLLGTQTYIETRNSIYGDEKYWRYHND